MRWKRGSRAFLRLPCVWLLLLLPLAAAAGLGEYGAFPSPTSSAERGEAGTHGSVKENVQGVAAEDTQRSGRRLDEDEASRILWRGWLLVDEAPSRRKAHITPKSVFIAPVIRGEGSRGGGIPACAEGYRSDAMGRCHKVVRVNQAAHLDFLLQRLNALYGEPSQAAPPASRGDAVEKGPLLLTIPLATNPPQDEESDGEDEGDDGVDLVVVAEASIQKGPFKDMPDRFGVFRGEQMAAESQDEMVVDRIADSVETTERMMADRLVDHPGGRNESEAVEEGKRDVSKTRQTVTAHIDHHNETVTVSGSSESTEEGSERVVTETTVLPTGEASNEQLAYTTNSPESKDTSADVTTDDGHFADGHIYETTFIADYTTTDSNGDKATESPGMLHNREIPQDKNSTDHRSDEIGSQQRIVFPGQVADDRVRFPDDHGHQQQQHSLYSNQPTPPAPPEALPISPSQIPKGHPRGGWNRPTLLKFWTQMPLIREPALGGTIKRASPTAFEREGASIVKYGDGWSFPGQVNAESNAHHSGSNQRRPLIYYQEMSPSEIASVSRVFDRVRHFEARG